MTPDATADADRLAAAVAAELPPPATWTMPPRGYRQSLALCTVDGIARRAGGDGTAEALVAAYRTTFGDDAEQAGADDLLTAIDSAGGPHGWIGSLAGGEAPDAVADAIAAGAHLLVRNGIRSTGDLVEHLRSEGLDGELGQAWTDTEGLTRRMWADTAMLAGYLDPEVDRIISGYVCRAIGSDPSTTTPERVIAALTEVAARTGSTILPLEFAMLRHEQR